MANMGLTGTNGAYLTGKLLLAMPAMGDPRFHKAVIFMCAHDAKGAMGLMINHVVPGVTFQQLLQQVNINQPENKAMQSQPVLNGGPVESARGFLLHSSEFAQSDTVKVTGDLYVTGTIDALRATASGQGPKQILFLLGYAGWGAGQLDREIQDNAWLVAEPNPELIFTTAPDEKWQKAIKTLGVDPAMLSGEAGRA